MANYYTLFAPATLVVAILVLIIAVVVFIFTLYGMFSGKSNFDNSDTVSTIQPSKLLNNLSLAVITCFTISVIAFLPASINGPYLSGSLGDWPTMVAYIFWGLGYIMMFFVFIYRLKEINGLSKRNSVIIWILLSLFIILFIIYIVLVFGGYRHLHTVKATLLIIGIMCYFIFAILIMALFSRQLFKQMKIESNDDMLQQPELLQLIIRYTVLGCIGIFTSICVTLTWAIYYSYMIYFWSFWDVWTMWILPMDEIVNMICIAFYLPMYTNFYDKLCCYAHKLFSNQLGRLLISKNNDHVSADQTQQI
eukprot:192746_1